MASEKVKDQYENITAAYDGIEALPHSHITQDLVKLALGDCTGKVILDIGGGSGLHARNAVALGAERVDNVDLSPDMCRQADEKEQRAGRKPGERVHSLVGDATQPLDHLQLPGRDNTGVYDVVMVIWTFDHGSTLPQLEGLWRNAAKYCRQGGQLVSVRCTDPWDRHEDTFKYGMELYDLQRAPGGCKYKFKPRGVPMPFECETTALEAHYDLEQARAMARKFGFDGLSVVDSAQTSCYKKEPEFWQAFVDHPGFQCVTATKL